MSKPEAGDTVRVTIEGVLYRHSHGLGLPSFGTVYHDEDRTLPANVRVDVLKKAKKVYKVGDTLTGAELKAHQWKRGTIIQSDYQAYVLRADSYWLGLKANDTFSFGAFTSEGFSLRYTIKYLPE